MPAKKRPLDFELDLDFTIPKKNHRDDDPLMSDFSSKPTYNIAEMVLMCALVAIMVFGACALFERAHHREPAVCSVDICR